MLWYGSVESIPSGWHLCDGTAGTIDLRDRFVLAAGGTSAPGDRGGAATHMHMLASGALMTVPGDYDHWTETARSPVICGGGDISADRESVKNS